MQRVPKNNLLEHHPDTLMVIRKDYNLDGPGMIEDAIRIIREWVEQQPHFRKKDFSDAYLEIVIYACKGSLERTKKQIDRMCTVRTLMPHFFEVRTPKTDYRYFFEAFKPVILPKLTQDHYRIYVLKITDKIHLIKDYLDFFTYGIMICDYIKIHGYCRGYISILDLTDTSVKDFLSNLNLVHFRQFFTIFIEGYGMRIKGIHIYTPSKLVNTFVKLLKQAVNPKVGGRIHTYKTLENLPDIVPLDILPEEYGGKEKSLNVIFDEWIEAISSEENLNYLTNLKNAGTDESCREKDKFNEDYAGMAGTFRVLSVD